MQSRDDVLEISVDVLAHYFGGDRHDEKLTGFVDALWRRFQELDEDE